MRPDMKVRTICRCDEDGKPVGQHSSDCPYQAWLYEEGLRATQQGRLAPTPDSYPATLGVESRLEHVEGTERKHGRIDNIATPPTALLLALVLLLVPTLVAAEPTPFRLTGHERIPARISDVLVTLPMLAATIDAARADDKSRAFLRLGCRNAVAMGLTELTKRLIHRTRPDGSDRLSMPSGHTATAMANSDSAWSYGVTLGVAWGRQAAGKHYATDVAVGAGVGGLARWVCR